jgi:hypothetical protein
MGLAKGNGEKGVLMSFLRPFAKHLLGIRVQKTKSLEDSACPICRFREAKGATTANALLETREASGVHDYTIIKGAADKCFVVEDHKVFGAEHLVVYALNHGADSISRRFGGPELT